MYMIREIIHPCGLYKGDKTQHEISKEVFEVLWKNRRCIVERDRRDRWTCVDRWGHVYIKRIRYARSCS